MILFFVKLPFTQRLHMVIGELNSQEGKQDSDEWAAFLVKLFLTS